MTYPPEPILAELGRITVQASRLDFWCGRLWLAMLEADGPTTPERRLETRAAMGKVGKIKRLVPKAVREERRQEFLDFLNGAQASARKARDVQVHSTWFLDGPADLNTEEGRAAMASGDLDEIWRQSVGEPWIWVHKDEEEATPAPTLEALVEVEYKLRRVTLDIRRLATNFDAFRD